MLKIINKIDFSNNLFVAKVDTSNANSSREERIKHVTDIASIVFGRLGFDTLIDNSDGGDIALKHWNKRVNLYNRLLKESGGEPSTVFEFIPVKISMSEMEDLTDTYDIDNIDYLNKIFKYSYIIRNDELPFGDEYLLTNMRTLLKAGIKEEDIPFNTPEELGGFTTIVGRIPVFALYHLDRHRAFTFNEESSRNKKYLNNVEFWYPEYWTNGLKKARETVDKLTVINLSTPLDRDITPEDATKELSMRRLNYFGMSAWKQNPDSYNNLFKVRSEDTGTQNITLEIVNNIKLCLNQ